MTFREKLRGTPEILNRLAELRITQRSSKANRARLEAVYRAIRSEDSLESISRDILIRKSRAFVARAVRKASKIGIESLLDVQHGGFRPERALISLAIGDKLRHSIATRTLRTSTGILNWLRDEHGIQMTRNGLYSWLRRHRVRIRPRRERKRAAPQHPSPS